MAFFEYISPAVAWLIAAVLFACLELAVPGMFACLAFSLGSIAAALSSYAGVGLDLQAAIGFATSILSFVVIRLLLIQAKLSESDTKKLATNI